MHGEVRPPFFLLTYQIFAPTHKLHALYDDFSDYYLGVKNSNKGTSEFLTFICLNLWCVLSIFGLFRAFLPSITSNFPIYFN